MPDLPPLLWPFFLCMFVQGMAMVAFPASATVLRERLHFTDAQYGTLFLPQIAVATTSALLAGALVGRLGLRRLLAASTALLGLACLTLFGALLAGPGPGFPIVLAGAGILGLGLGLGSAPLSAYPVLAFPRHRDTAVIASHTVVCAGISAAPLLVGILVDRGLFYLYPLVAIVANGALSIAVLRMRLPADPSARSARKGEVQTRRSAAIPFVILAMLYAITEAMLANWTLVFLREDRGLAASTAALGLCGFWAALTLGRVGVAALTARTRPEPVWFAIPVLLCSALLLLPLASGPRSGLLLFAFGGFACSAFYPLTVSIASRRFLGQEGWICGIVFSGLAAGTGLGSVLPAAVRPWLGLAATYRWMAVFPALCLILALRIERREPRS